MKEKLLMVIVLITIFIINRTSTVIEVIAMEDLYRRY